MLSLSSIDDLFLVAFSVTLRASIPSTRPSKLISVQIGTAQYSLICGPIMPGHRSLNDRRLPFGDERRRYCFGKAFWADGLEIHVLVFVGSDQALQFLKDIYICT